MAIFTTAPVATMSLQSADTETTETFSDERLVVAAQAGDRAAFGQLYQRFARMVHGILLTRVPGAAAEDLVQDVFLHALPKLHTLREPSRFGPWLAAITRNRASDFHRGTKDERSIEEVPGAVESVTDSAASNFDRANGLAVLRAVRELPDVYREPLVLRFVEGMTGPEIAERTGLTHGSVRVNLHRGMELLREKLKSSHVRAGQEKTR